MLTYKHTENRIQKQKCSLSLVVIIDCNPGIEFSILNPISGLGLQISRHFGIPNGLNYAYDVV